ncbi:MAG TPA: hypothetical protein VMP08_09775 [Anaerolineae bacterium]|nr:hypothetical protein [Anaerolineae bacterium]
MSPDIQWHVGEDQETIHAPTPRRSRRSWIAIVIVVILGAGLGVAYRSLPEPAPRPTPTSLPTPQPTPTHLAVPAQLYATIDREAQALADGDLPTYFDLHVYEDVFWTQQFTTTFQAWQRPTDSRPLYSIIDFNLRGPNHAWADIRQFRNGRSFRETRFYVWDNDRWLRDDPDPFFWSGESETYYTPHLQVVYAVEDRELAQRVADQIEELSIPLCARLKCAALTSPLTQTISMNHYQLVGNGLSDDGQSSSMLSPRVTGIYEDAHPYYLPGDDLTYSISWVIAQRIAYGRAVNSLTKGAIIMNAIANWAGSSVNHTISRDQLRIAWNKWLGSQSKPLESLWEIGVDDDWQTAHTEAFAMIYFINEQYGAAAVPNVLRNLGQAQSLADLIEKSLGVPFAEFDQKWQAWVKQNLSDR